MEMKKTEWIFVFVIVFLYGCDQFPKDSKDTLKNSQDKILKVGLCNYDSAANASVEPVENQIRFVRQFARSINSEIVWVKGAQEEITGLLRHYELHMAIGGYTAASPFKKEITLSKPYYRDTLKLVSKNGILPGKIKGEKVLVNNYLAALYVRQRGAIPEMSANPGKQEGFLIAATNRELKLWGLSRNGKILHEWKYAVAVPFGENAFLAALEKFIDNYDSPVQ